MTPPVLVTRKDLPASNLQMFVAFAKANQDTIKFASSGVGAGTHLTCMLLNTRLGISAVHVPYRSSALAYNDLLAGRVDYMCDYMSTALPQIEAKSVNAIAMLTAERNPVLPNLATANEQGLAGFDAPGWYGLVVPKGTPDDVVRTLNKAMSNALDSAAVKGPLAQFGNTVAPPSQRTPEYLAQYIRSEIDKWAEPIKASGISLD